MAGAAHTQSTPAAPPRRALFEALEATPATAGRFELNEYLSVHFGRGAAEVDLLSREYGIAVEVDGYLS